MDIRAPRRRRLTPLAIGAGLVGSAVLGLGATGTFSALTATITNTNNTAGTGSIVMQETDSSGSTTGTCKSTDGNTVNSSTCTSFNKYGGNLALRPGAGTSTQTIRIYNIGSLSATGFTIRPTACNNSTNPMGTSGNICNYLKVNLTCAVTTANSTATAVTVYDGSLTNANLTQIASNGAVNLTSTKACTPQPSTTLTGATANYTTFSFTVTLDSTAGNDIQGQAASQNIEWQFTA